MDNYPGIGLGPEDDMESYTVGVEITGLNGGRPFYLFWGSPYTSNSFLVLDDMESYTVTANLNGLNGGSADYSTWGGAYVDR